MTTSFAWFARANFLASLYVQPMGMLLAVLAVVTFWSGLYIAVTGRAAWRLITFVPTGYWLYPLLTWGLVAWAWKIVIYKLGVGGWS